MATTGWRHRNQTVENLQRHQRSNSFQRQPYQGRNQSNDTSSQRNQNQGGKNRSEFDDGRQQNQKNIRWNQNQNRNNPQWQNLSPYDRRSFVLRSKDFKWHLIQTLDQIFARIDTWYPDEVVTNDRMDWQPEIEVVIPQVENAAYTYGPLGSSTSDYASERKEAIKLGFAGPWRNNGVDEIAQQGEIGGQGRNWDIPRSATGVEDYRTANFLLPSARPYYHEEEEIG